ncbi:MAG: hypothetical protein ACR2IV_05025 [Bryobacteraceae bacterium]
MRPTNSSYAAQKFTVTLTQFGAVEVETKDRIRQNHYHTFGCAVRLDNTVQGFLHPVQLFFALAPHLDHLVLSHPRLLVRLLGCVHCLFAPRLRLLPLLLRLNTSSSSYFSTSRGFFRSPAGC